MTQGNQPIRRLRIGHIGAAIFENRTEEGKTFYNVQFTRGYREMLRIFRTVVSA